MDAAPGFSALVAEMPMLRRVSMRFCRGNSHDAEDLMQRTLLRALAAIDQFSEGTSLAGWLYVIMRNERRDWTRRRRREVEVVDGATAARLAVAPAQEVRLRLLELGEAVGRLPWHQREALGLIAAGLSYEEAALVMGCSGGTVKSRVHRARAALAGY